MELTIKCTRPLFWGWNFYGQLNVPAPNADFVALVGGGEHSLGLKADGSIVAWGWNRAGQCDVPTPNTGFVAIAAGSNHSLGIMGSSCDPCDMNCDGDVNALDIEPFLELLFGPNPDPCDTCTGDVNGDGNIDALDIEPFLNCLFP